MSTIPHRNGVARVSRIGFGLLGLFVCCSTIVQADSSLGVQIGTGDSPRVSGDFVVWSAGRAIYLFDMMTGGTTQIAQLTLAGTPSCPAGGLSHPDVRNNLIVWDDHTDPHCGDFYANWDIHVCQYDRVTKTCPVYQVTTSPTSQFLPRISETGLIAWQDQRNYNSTPSYTNSDIFACVYDPVTRSCGPEFQITSDPHNQTIPRVSGNQIVWNDDRNIFSNVYTCQLDPQAGLCPEVRLTDASAQYGAQGVSGSKIAILLGSSQDGSRLPPRALYVYDLQHPELGLQLVVEYLPALPVSADIDGKDIVFQDSRNLHFDLYASDLTTATTIQLTTDPLNETSPAVSEGRVVFQHNAYNIFLKALPGYQILGPNLVSNGSFEEGKTKWVSWSYHQGLTIQTAFEGRTSVKFKVGSNFRDIRSASVSVQAGRRYEASTAIKTNIVSPGITAGTSAARVEWRKAGGALIKVDGFGSHPNISNWTRYAVTLTAPAEAAKADIRLFTIGGTGGTGEAYFDDVRLQQVIE